MLKIAAAADRSIELPLSAERMWISRQPPFAHNAQRLSEKWTTCEDLLEFTSPVPQEAIQVFRMSCKTVQ